MEGGGHVVAKEFRVAQQKACFRIVVRVPSRQRHARKEKVEEARASTGGGEKLFSFYFFLGFFWTASNGKSEEFPAEQRQGSQNRSLFGQSGQREPDCLPPRTVFYICG